MGNRSSSRIKYYHTIPQTDHNADSIEISLNEKSTQTESEILFNGTCTVCLNKQQIISEINLPCGHAQVCEG